MLSFLQKKNVYDIIQREDMFEVNSQWYHTQRRQGWSPKNVVRYKLTQGGNASRRELNDSPGTGH
jgi:hypothetical protein